MWDGTSYQGDDGVMFHYLEGSPNRNYTMDPPEFDWLQSIFKDTTYADAYEHIKSNVTYVLKKICKNLNNHIHDRGYFQAKMMEHDLMTKGKLQNLGQPLARTISNKTTVVVQAQSPPQKKIELSSPSSSNEGMIIASNPNILSQNSKPMVKKANDNRTMSDLRKKYIKIYNEWRGVKPRFRRTIIPKEEINKTGVGGKKKITRKRRRKKKKKKSTRKKK